MSQTLCLVAGLEGLSYEQRSNSRARWRDMAGLTMSTSQTLVSNGGTCKFGIALRQTPLSNGVTTVLYGVNRLTYILLFFCTNYDRFARQFCFVECA